MPPNDKAKTASRPDCPRQYHDDYVSRPPGRTRGPILLTVLGGLVLICAALYVISRGGMG